MSALRFLRRTEDFKTIGKALSGELYLPVLIVIMFSVIPPLAEVTFTDNQMQFLPDHTNLLFQDFTGTFVAPGNFIGCNPPENYQSNDNCFN